MSSSIEVLMKRPGCENLQLILKTHKDKKREMVYSQDVKVVERFVVEKLC